MESWLPLLVGPTIVFILQQRQKCIEEGRPFFRAGRRSVRKKRTQPTSGRASLPRTDSHQRSSPNEDALAPQRAASQPSPDIMVRTDLVRRLNALTHNDATAKRLIRSLKQRHPERSLDWCAERAINDIERDRR